MDFFEIHTEVRHDFYHKLKINNLFSWNNGKNKKIKVNFKTMQKKKKKISIFLHAAGK